ncbi:MAG TPA: hypothetical protein VJJ22_01590 [Candidatus Paceibacterota bacterium]
MPATTSTYERINISLPKATVKLLKQVAPLGNRSRFIELAVRDYARKSARARLETELKEGALRNAQRDINISMEWAHVDNDVWQTHK